jgi:hypothetical protein
MNDNQLFAFEDDFVASLRCIPMAVRLKLDRSGIKLSLRQWSRFTREDRAELLETPCATALEVEAYLSRLIELVALRAKENAKALPEPLVALWEFMGAAPAVVIDYAQSVGVPPPSAREWRRLTELQRFALIKLTRDSHDNVNFVPAMREFGLA